MVELYCEVTIGWFKNPFIQAYTNALAEGGLPGLDDLRDAFGHCAPPRLSIFIPGRVVLQPPVTYFSPSPFGITKRC
jgi:hypothetical protein